MVYNSHMTTLTKVATNNKGMSIDYGPDLEEKIRAAYKMQSNEPVTDEMVFQFFSSAHTNALNKGYAIDEG